MEEVQTWWMKNEPNCSVHVGTSTVNIHQNEADDRDDDAQVQLVQKLSVHHSDTNGNKHNRNTWIHSLGERLMPPSAPELNRGHSQHNT